MKIVAPLLLLSSMLSYGLATPLFEPRATIDDTVILNFALTLEYLEADFYTGALARFDNTAFIIAGFYPRDRQRFVEIAKHEAEHVAFLQKALGAKATKACSYKFPYTDVKSFVALSMVLEGVGVSAYLGAAGYISNKDYLTAAASILTTEARHAAWVSAVVGKQAAWGGALDTALGLNQVYTLAASMIVSCPTSNPSLPVKAFPVLTLASVSLGNIATVIYASVDKRAQGPVYVAFFHAGSVVYEPVRNGGVLVPKLFANAGQVYAVVTAEIGRVDDSRILAGPAILTFASLTALF